MAQPLQERLALAQPALSPDGEKLAFASGGSIWEAPATGGDAHLLVSDGGDDQRPLYSPDGHFLAFTSTRDGSPNIYVLDLTDGHVKRMTWSDATEELDAWSKDGRWLYFSSSASDIGRKTDVMRIPSTGGTPAEVSGERYLPEFQANPSPDGASVALMARGLSNIQWWRNGHSHIDETELWLKSLSGPGGYHRILDADAKHAWPMWTPDGRTIVYMSDANGTENLWQVALTPNARPEQLTYFSDGRLLFPTMAANGGAIVFERDFAIWRYDVGKGQAMPVRISLRGAVAMPGPDHEQLREFSGLAVSPDGEKIAVVAHGKLFAAPAKNGGLAQRLGDSAGAESTPIWSPDSRKLIYVAERGLDRSLVERDLVTGKQTLLTTKGIASAPVYSPDGRSVVYILGQRELHLIELPHGGRPKHDRLLFEGPLVTATWSDVQPVWSPDGQYIAFPVTDHRSFVNVFVVPASGGNARPVSFLANGEMNGITWSPDGTYILFSSGQRNEDARIVRIDLTPHVPKYREDEFRNLFKPDMPPGSPPPGESRQPPIVHNGDDAKTDEATKGGATKSENGSILASNSQKPKKIEPVKIDWDNLRERATVLPLGVAAEAPVVSSDGKTLVFRATERERENFYSYDLDELARETPVARQITTTAGSKGDFGLSGDGKSFFYLDDGKVFSVQLAEFKAKPKLVNVDAEMDVDFTKEKQVVFNEVWGTLDRYFYDPQFNGKDWTALRAKFEPYIAGARTTDELRRIINLLIGELDASHSGIFPPRHGTGSVAADRIGQLGLRFQRATGQDDRPLTVREVVALGPSAIDGDVHTGDQLVSVDGTAIGPHINLDSLLENKVGKRVALGIITPAGARREAIVKPVSLETESGLVYRQWVDERRMLVDRLSGGKLGYVHLQDMSSGALNQLYLDLDADNEAKQGVVIDIRNNNGGFVHGHALDVFARRNFLTLTPRGLFPLPARQLLGQRALGLATALVTNESSLSDAEDFTEGYRALGLGKVVGEPTAGWIIYTGEITLIDGSVLRVPQLRVRDLQGRDMEMLPRPVDVAVEQPLGDTDMRSDAQLAAAVRVLLGDIANQNATSAIESRRSMR